jgi:hypothetical protein
MTVRLGLTRPQILAFRRHAGELDTRLPPGQDSLRRAAWAGLQDSMPRAAVLSIHARVEGTEPSTGPRVAAPARLLPSGDSFFLLQGADRELLVPEADRRQAVWTPRVWPGGLLLGGELAGTWRRAGTALTVQPWRQLSSAERDAVVAEAESLPLPTAGKRIVVRWADPAKAN